MPVYAKYQFYLHGRGEFGGYLHVMLAINFQTVLGEIMDGLNPLYIAIF